MQNNGGWILGVLGIVFVTLKLIGIIDWSWWWVTLPFWGSLAVALTLLAGFVIIVVVKHFYKKWRAK